MKKIDRAIAHVEHVRLSMVRSYLKDTSKMRDYSVAFWEGAQYELVELVEELKSLRNDY